MPWMPLSSVTHTVRTVDALSQNSKRVLSCLGGNWQWATTLASPKATACHVSTHRCPHSSAQRPLPGQQRMSACATHLSLSREASLKDLFLAPWHNHTPFSSLGLKGVMGPLKRPPQWPPEWPLRGPGGGRGGQNGCVQLSDGRGGSAGVHCGPLRPRQNNSTVVLWPRICLWCPCRCPSSCAGLSTTRPS